MILNKADSFKNKLNQGILLKNSFRDYVGDNTYDSCIQFIINQFLSRQVNTGQHSRVVVAHVTNAVIHTTITKHHYHCHHHRSYSSSIIYHHPYPHPHPHPHHPSSSEQFK